MQYDIFKKYKLFFLTLYQKKKLIILFHKILIMKILITFPLHYLKVVNCIPIS